MTTNPDGKPYIHNAEQSEAAKHGRMILPTTQPTHADLAWYERELVLANEHKDDWMALHYAIQSECAKLRAALTAALSVLDEHAEEERKFWGAEDKHGLASEAEKIHDQARAALSSPNVAAEPRAAKTQETPRSSAACAAWESGLGDGPSVSLVFAQRLDCELIALTAERDHLHAQLRALTLICGTNDANKFETWIDRANARAERAEAAETIALAQWNGALERAMKAEADLAALEQCHDDNCRALVKLDAELAAAQAQDRNVSYRLERDKAEAERTDAIYQRVCEVERELRAEVKRMRSDRDCEKRLRKDADEFRENAIERAIKAEAELAKYLSACPASPTEEERKRCQQWWAISGKAQ